MATLEPDRNQIETFGEALFRYASPTSFVSVRSFLDLSQSRFRETI